MTLHAAARLSGLAFRSPRAQARFCNTEILRAPQRITGEINFAEFATPVEGCSLAGVLVLAIIGAKAVTAVVASESPLAVRTREDGPDVPLDRASIVGVALRVEHRRGAGMASVTTIDPARPLDLRKDRSRCILASLWMEAPETK